MKLFLIYEAANRELAELVSSLFNAQGIDATAQAHVATPGQSIHDAVLDGIRETDAVVVLLTAGATSSDNIAYEVGFAMALAKPIHVLFDGMTIDAIPDFLKSFPASGLSQIGEVARKFSRLAQVK
ncbi:MAG TPA: toll/interleukin-1 receptor domain-containing protein [Caulifigura sp.]|jgi:nucleoside 2-deoxyribosyltransferase|nr:toll/interleukin-1 receptor domain-containing protein [Caulifigura sp.]